MVERNGDPNSRPIIHLATALARLGDDRELLRDLAGFFLEDVPALQQNLQQGLESRDAELVTRSAHSIKGLCANFDAEVALELAAEIEACGRAADFAGAASRLAALQAATGDVQTALRNEVLN
jgi:HPt (histidine-containing phosphotransfer) domain-containing protein